MDRDRFIVHVKTEDITKILQKMLKQDLALQILNYRPLPNGEKMIGLMKDELGGQIKKEFGGLRA